MSRRLTRLSVALLPLVALLAAAPPNSSAQVAFEPTMEPTLISSPGTRQLTFRLRMTTGPRVERFLVTVSPPSWPFLSGLGRPAGHPVQLDCGLVLEGAGSLRNAGCVHADVLYYSCLRGYNWQETSGIISLPPNSRSTLVAHANRSVAPLRRTDPRVVFTASRGPDGTLAGEQMLRPAAPTLSGPFGVPIVLSTRPSSTDFPRRLRRGARVVIRGRTLRSLRGEAILLRAHYADPRVPRLRTLAHARVDRRGRFGPVSWRPRRRGSYDLYAVYRSHRSGLTSDSSCTHYFRVR